MSEISETEIKSMTKEQNYLRGYRDGKSDVLDKIRAEIEHHRRKTQGIDPFDLVGDCLYIIDRHREESEEKG